MDVIDFTHLLAPGGRCRRAAFEQRREFAPCDHDAEPRVFQTTLDSSTESLDDEEAGNVTGFLNAALGHVVMIAPSCGPEVHGGLLISDILANPPPCALMGHLQPAGRRPCAHVIEKPRGGRCPNEGVASDPGPDRVGTGASAPALPCAADQAPVSADRLRRNISRNSKQSFAVRAAREPSLAPHANRASFPLNASWNREITENCRV